MLSDTTLLSQLKTGDEASFEAIFLRHYDRIYGVLFRLLGNRSDAEDVAQKVFLKLYQAPNRVRAKDEDETHLVGWLYRVAMNEGYNLLRSRRRRQGWMGKFIQQWRSESSEPDPAQMAENQVEQDQTG